MSEKQQVVVTDIQIPFLSMVALMVKGVLASIPAMIIVTILGALFMAVIGSMNMGMMMN
ncbi:MULTISPECIES: hypothetical protein [Limibacillus]|jgi:hypothetical protein|uniref:Uncharacterized protein n=1 Tax=Limibacillus halophilus TaxID=1579333 RepID=A0A839SV54_9PROT|nr:hypothetical protein [Limibacillus halophilus]MBB3066687.1 hypothetical protein [Limibacillus halophilus]